ncbi:MAG: hypothetical protein WCE69_03740 [Aestuariivirga sp.]
MAAFADLLHAIAALLWPAFAFTALYIFRSQIANLVARLKRGKFLGQEFELQESLTRLDMSAAAVENEVAALPASQSSEPTPTPEQQSVIQQIISEAAKSPKTALILLAVELEKITRQILASTGYLGDRKFIPLSKAIVELDKTFGLPRHVQGSLKNFWEARSRLIHGGEADTDDVLRAIDSGLTILKALQAMPHETNVVYSPSTALYADPECKTLVTDGKGIILETESPGGARKNLRIFPSTRTHFQKGRRVAWEWNFDKRWGPAWYRDPETNEIRSAWLSSTEFIGRHLDDI